MNPTHKLGTWVRSRRKAMGITLPALAGRSGVQKSTISKLENGIGNPSLSTLLALAAALKISVAGMLSVALKKR